MKSKFHVLAALVCALALTACGGGSKKNTTPVPVIVQPAYSQTDTATGTGPAAADGDLVTLQYTGWEYDTTQPNNHGTKIDSTADRGAPVTFTLGYGQALPGLDQGVIGMQVGGTRTLVLPATLGLGAGDVKLPVNGTIPAMTVPANTPLVFDVALVSVQKAPPVVTVPDPTNLGIINTVTGTGTTAVGPTSSVTVNYTGWLFNGSASNLKGAQFDTDAGAGLSFKLGATPPAVIAGWEQGLQGMVAGGKRTLIIPANLAYGATGNGSIPPNTALVFDVVVVSVN